MTGAAHDRGRGGGPSSSFLLPESLTLAGRHAFAGAVEDYVAQLTEQLDRQAHRQHRPASVHTTRDVLDARHAYEQRLREQEDDEHAGDVRGLAVILLLVAAGLGVLATYTSGIAQAALLGLFVATETAGLLLIWRSRPRLPGPDE